MQNVQKKKTNGTSFKLLLLVEITDNNPKNVKKKNIHLNTNPHSSHELTDL